MDIAHINGVLTKVRIKLESLDPARLQESQLRPEEHNPKRVKAIKSRMGKLYARVKANKNRMRIPTTSPKR